jgi:hypothetical protein
MFTGTPISYSGRTVDVSALGNMQAGTTVTPGIYQPGGNGELLQGTAKLMQRFFLELLTISGSLPFDLSRGCDFLLDALNGFWQTPGDVYTSFASAKSTVRLNLLSDQQAADPDDERYGDAQITSVILTQDSVVLTVQMTAVSGDTLTLGYPLNF